MPDDQGSPRSDLGPAAIDLLRRAFRARGAEVERLRGALARHDGRVDLLRRALSAQSGRAERALAAREGRIADALRLLQRRGDAPAGPDGAEAVRATGLFDDDFYRAAYPDVAVGGADPAAHYAEVGWWEGRNPNPRFDTASYLADNPDVAASGRNPLVHYAEAGFAEGRSALAPPRARRYLRPLDGALSAEQARSVEAVLDTGLFDARHYRRTNLDVARLGLEPAVHFALDGWREGRRPNPAFDPAFYLARYPDVAASGENPLVHFARVGLIEARLPSPEAATEADGGDDEAAREVRATGLFDEGHYLARYPDVAATGVDAALHFARVGWKEGRTPHPDFDPRYYLDHNPDIAALGVNPLLHFAEHGLFEGRPFSARLASALSASAAPASTYARWVALHDTLDAGDRRAIRARLSRLRRRPLISIVMPVYDPPLRFLRDAVASVQGQLYPDWELCVADDASTDPAVAALLGELAAAEPRIRLVVRPENGHISAASNSALALARGEFVALMDHDDLLAEHALFAVAAALDARPALDVLYSDEDHVDAEGRRHTPYFKPDYNPELMLGHNMVNHLGVYRRSLLERIGGFRLGFEGSQDYDLALRAVDASAPERVHHIPHVLYHWRSGAEAATFSEAFLERCLSSARRAIADHLARRGEAGEVVEHPSVPTWHRVRRARPDPAPLVSVVVPTKDKADLVRTCVEGVLHRTGYPEIEVLVVDHQSTEEPTLALFAELSRDPRVRVLPHAGPFNYSAINNAAVARARGSVLALLNNDVDVIAPEWLDEMVSLAVRPDVGAVGAKLLYPDDRVQHAGVLIGAGGVAGHYFHHLHRDDPGYFGRAILTAAVSGVTAACLVVRRSVFEEVGGFDAENLPVAFNDVDLCLKIRAAGYRNVWTPHALLYHHESVSRGSDLEGERLARFQREVGFMQDKWGDELTQDPFYSPNLDLDAANFTLAPVPRHRTPWRR